LNTIISVEAFSKSSETSVIRLPLCTMLTTTFRAVKLTSPHYVFKMKLNHPWAGGSTHVALGEFSNTKHVHISVVVRHGLGKRLDDMISMDEVEDKRVECRFG
jgi:hypothetical protein